ncbi:MAG TPA: TIGR00730 family Rossman fold protein [Candidatus Saccharimonadales bacterium]|nr:TIGR00730 family Rossman fold protein [Candidatus Saccharimonadales bacterium]
MHIFSRKAERITPEALQDARQKYPPRATSGRNIAVFCAATTPDNKVFVDDAREVGELIGEGGHNLVWGATDSGLMKVVATAARARKARLLGVSFVGARDGARSGRADRLFGAQDITERKDTMLKLANVVLAMPGGVGTFDEVGSALQRKKGNDTLPPIVLLNRDGFFDGVLDQLHMMYREGLIMDPVEDLVRTAANPKEAISLAERIQPVVHTSEQLLQRDPFEPPIV